MEKPREWQQPGRLLARAESLMADGMNRRERNFHDLLMLIGLEMRRRKALKEAAAKEGTG